MMRFCRDCGFESEDYETMCAHVRSDHGREPLCGPTLAVGDIIQHKGVDVRVLELFDDGRALVQPLPVPALSVRCEYRIADQRWARVP